ncbi:DUF4097 domain-containing protein [candidate division WOR-3 bacterium]|uniref:DUF4097 domain-containing protein n=1 Tax=candidate division WOR-3 bacterium TaxID=2052148 RepID=A0A938BSM3_UNCW3|nr:DUF4097 domain-containing protein [candidate division WOR-3 bacterium]
MRYQLRRFLPALLLAAACLYTYRLDVAKTHTYPAAGISGLNASTKNGFIRVTASTDTVLVVVESTYAYGRNLADAEQYIANVIYSDTVVGNELRVKAEDTLGGSRPYGASFTITAPDTIDLALSTTNGEISVTSTVGSINANTTNAGIELIGTRGTASVSTTNGKLDVAVHSGALYGATTNGAIDCDIAVLDVAEDVGLATTNGKVTLLLPADVSAVVEVTNSTGMITIHDFTVTYETQTEHHVRARIGSGASDITITTTNADVVVRRRS